MASAAPGPFRVVRTIGKGVSGRVVEIELKAEKRMGGLLYPPGRRFAMKVSEGGVYTCLTEWDIMLRSGHPNVLGAVKVCKIPATLERPWTPALCVVMPLGDFTLSSLIELEPVPLNLLHQIVQGIAYLHRGGVLHGDIKPDNFVVFDGGRTVRVCDFSASRLMAGRDKVLGEFQSAPFSPPESLTTPWAEAGFESDVWALGVLLANAISGEHPYWTKCAGLAQGNIPKFLRDVFPGGGLRVAGPRYADEYSLAPALIRQMAAFENTKRITCVEALSDPLWGDRSCATVRDMVAALPDELSAGAKQWKGVLTPQEMRLGSSINARFAEVGAPDDHTNDTGFAVAEHLLSADPDLTIKEKVLIQIGKALRWRFYSD